MAWPQCILFSANWLFERQSHWPLISAKTQHMKIMKTISARSFVLIALIGFGGLSAWIYASARNGSTHDSVVTKPVLTVEVTSPQIAEWPVTLTANGSIFAWQEAIIGAEVNGLQVSQVSVNVGDRVTRGQVLARFARDSVDAAVAEQIAAVEEAKARLDDAHANAERARTLTNSGGLSIQQINEYLTAERMAAARLKSANAKLQSEQIRKQKTEVLAPDDGIISSRSIAVGSLAQQGQELFKLIRQYRLEWRAEVSSDELPHIRPKQIVHLNLPGGVKVDGKVRMLAPTIDSQTRNALVYVDLKPDEAARPGMFASGTFELGHANALSLPYSAIVMQNGNGYVFTIDSSGKVAQAKVKLGRRHGDRIEVLSGVSANVTIVQQGASFLSDGDTVRIAPTSPAVSATSTNASQAPRS